VSNGTTVRVGDLAVELNMESRRLLDVMREMKIDKVMTPGDRISTHLADEIRKKISGRDGEELIEKQM